MNTLSSISLISQEHQTASHPVSPGWSTASRVLVVGNDIATGEQHQELVGSLGYSCTFAPDALSALRLIAADSSIGIVLIELKMDTLDGVFLLNEISDRFLDQRPLITIAVGDAQTDLTVEVMRAGASDMIEKPLALNALSDCLRRAVSRWTRLAHQFRASTLPLDSQPGAAKGRAIGAAEPSFADLQDLGARLIKSRQIRGRYISDSLMSEAAWGILLDLAVAGLKGERVATSSACASAQVPLSTALRHVNQLIKAGWIKRVGDPDDKRRTFIELQPNSFDQMVKYLRASWEVFGAPTPDRPPCRPRNLG